MIKHTGYSPYRSAILSLNFDGANIHGTMYPLAGDKTPPVQVSGDNETHGILHLKLQADPKSGFQGLSVTLKKSIDGDRIQWAADDADVTVWRPAQGLLSEAAQTLSYQECGSSYGSLAIWRKNAPTANQIEQALKAVPELADLIVQKIPEAEPPKDAAMLEFGLVAKRYPKLFSKVRLNDFLKDKKNYTYGTTDDWHAIPMVPNGSEVFLAKALRETGLFNVDFDGGGCGGADRSYFTTGRQNLFDNGSFSEEKFTKFITEKLEAFVSNGGKFKYNISKPKVTKVKIPPYPVDLQFEVRAASEVTRGDKGNWDQFKIYFEPFDSITNSSDQYSVVTWVDRMQTVRRSAGNSSPPDASYFTKLLEDYYEAVATTAFASALGQGDCVFEKEGFPDYLGNEKLVNLISAKMKCDY
ncbi:hypothetical protein GR250_04255 [Rhizobium leguminosarum]|nr:hypothetical protein [Rhizobium leguminosarum]